MSRTRLKQLTLLLQDAQFDQLNTLAATTPGKTRMDLLREGVTYVLAKYARAAKQQARVDEYRADGVKKLPVRPITTPKR